MRLRNLVFVGTSHIAKESVRLVEETIRSVKPSVVALELDRARFVSLSSKKRGVRVRDLERLGVKGFLFNLVGGWMERRLGKMVGSEPGDEMRAAVRAAREVGASVVLIDQDIHVTLKRLSERVSWREKIVFLVGMLGSFMRKSDGVDLNTVPSPRVIKKLTGELRRKFPAVYEVLIVERNEVMAKYLYNVARSHKGKIVVVVGAGHVDDVVRLLNGKRWK